MWLPDALLLINTVRLPQSISPHWRPINSLARKPKQPATRTIALYGSASSFNNALNSFGVRTRGMLLRAVDCRTRLIFASKPGVRPRPGLYLQFAVRENEVNEFYLVSALMEYGICSSYSSGSSFWHGSYTTKRIASEYAVHDVKVLSEIPVGLGDLQERENGCLPW